MSHEKLHSGQESGESLSLDLDAEIKRNAERLREKAEQAEAQPQDIEEIKSEVEAQAISGKEVTIGEHQEDSQPSLAGTQRELKMDAYKRTMQKIRKHLNPAERSFSRLVHQKTIDSLSNLGSKTIARPSGLLGAGLVSFAGSTLLLYSAKHYGFRYNFFVFFLLFAIGFGLGIVLEFAARIVKRRSV